MLLRSFEHIPDFVKPRTNMHKHAQTVPAHCHHSVYNCLKSLKHNTTSEPQEPCSHQLGQHLSCAAAPQHCIQIVEDSATTGTLPTQQFIFPGGCVYWSANVGGRKEFQKIVGTEPVGDYNWKEELDNVQNHHIAWSLGYLVDFALK